MRKLKRLVRKWGPLPVGIAVVSAGALITTGVMAAVSAAAGGRRRNPGPGRTAVIGDSIVAHRNGFVRFLDRSLPDRSFENFGVVGQGTSRIKRDLEQRVLGHGFDEVIVEGGMNDIGRSNAPQYITENLRDMVQTAKDAGLKVVLVTLTPWHRATRNVAEVNSIILSQGRSWGADVVVDFHSPLRTSAGALRDDLGSPDRIHPNYEGQQTLGRALLERAYA